MNPLRKGFSGTLWLLIAATAVRLLFSLAVHPPGHFVFSDMLTNYDHSRRLRGFHFNPWDTFNPIGYPVLLALIDPTGRHFWTVAVVQSLLGGILCLLAALISEKISNSRHVATAVFVATAFYFPHIYYCGFILTEIPSAFFFTFFFWLLLGVQGPDDRIRLAGAGLSLSAASIVRPNMLLIFAAVPFYLWLAFRRDPKAAGKALRPFFLAALPLIFGACLHNSILLRHPAGLASNGGLNFFLARAEVRMIRYQTKDAHYFIGPIPNMLRYKKDLDSPEPFYNESYYYKEGLQQIRNDPHVLLRSLNNIVEGVGLGLQDYWPGWDPVKKGLRGFSQGFFWLVLLPVLLLPLWLTLRGRLCRPEESPQFLIAFTTVILFATFYVFLGDPRIHIPFDAVFIAFAAEAYRRGFKGLLRRPS